MTISLRSLIPLTAFACSVVPSAPCRAQSPTPKPSVNTVYVNKVKTSDQQQKAVNEFLRGRQINASKEIPADLRASVKEVKRKQREEVARAAKPSKKSEAPAQR